MHDGTTHVETPPDRPLPDSASAGADGAPDRADAASGAGHGASSVAADLPGRADRPGRTDRAGRADRPGRAELEGTLAELVERLSVALERSNVLDYTILLQHPWRMMWINFLSGAARGLGIGIGFTVLTAVLLYILRGLMVANLPVIGDLIATIVRLVEQQLRP
ncbi:DUF5665 domain-containing protein [Symbiobacterium terraclitae]|uniref:DUF5665 domain-containing protein n=1 Tax=Symbiobacterium terraclitae TaxID=557451 RepID=UPI0035B52F42